MNTINTTNPVELGPRDALLIVDVQHDFLPGGALPVPDGDAVIPLLNRYITIFKRHALPIYATRDWHPPNHVSFKAQGGPWPPHCVAGSVGAAFAEALKLPSSVCIVSKARTRDQDDYSGFGGTNLAQQLHSQSIKRLFIGGLATDYCVLNTVRDALALDFEVMLLQDAVRPVEVHDGDGEAAIDSMLHRGAKAIQADDVKQD